MFEVVPVSECSLQNVQLNASRGFSPLRFACAALLRSDSGHHRCVRALFLRRTSATFAATVMEYLLSVTGSGARVVRDAISQRLWPGAGHQAVPMQPLHAGSAHESLIELSDTG